MKQITLVFLLLILPFFTVSVMPVYGKIFQRNNQEIEILWKQKKDELRVWGKVSGGKSTCKQMNLEIYFDNSESGQFTRVSATIKSFRPIGRNNYKAKVKIYNRFNREFHRRSSRNQWFVANYYLNCLN